MSAEHAATPHGGLLNNRTDEGTPLEQSLDTCLIDIGAILDIFDVLDFVVRKRSNRYEKSGGNQTY